MNERREPTISADLGEPLDTSKRPKTRAQAVPQGQKPIRSSSRKSKSRNSPVAVLAFILALVALGGAGFLYTELMNTQKLLNDTSSLLSQADTRIASLEGKLEVSGDESVQSMTALQAKIKVNASEVAKLWVVAYERNRKTIANNKAALSKLTEAYKGENTKLNNTLAGLSGDVSVLSELMDAQQGVIGRVDQARNSQLQAITDLTQRLNAMDKQFGKKVLSNEEAIKAIDAFRVQVNRDLMMLKGG